MPWTPDRIAALSVSLYGDVHGRLKRLAAELGVSYDAMRHVLSGRRSMPPGWAADLDALLSRVAGSPVAAPPPDTAQSDDRDDECTAALAPHLDRLMAQAIVAGWHPAEVSAAALAWALGQISTGAGPDEAREILDQASAALG